MRRDVIGPAVHNILPHEEAFSPGTAVEQMLPTDTHSELQGSQEAFLGSFGWLAAESQADAQTLCADRSRAKPVHHGESHDAKKTVTGVVQTLRSQREAPKRRAL